MSQTDLFQALDMLASGPKFLGSHKAKMSACLNHFAENGFTLAICADDRHLDRSLSTLKAYARELRLKFPDYVPLALRPPKPKAAKP